MTIIDKAGGSPKSLEAIITKRYLKIHRILVSFSSLPGWTSPEEHETIHNYLSFYGQYCSEVVRCTYRVLFPFRVSPGRDSISATVVFVVYNALCVEPHRWTCCCSFLHLVQRSHQINHNDTPFSLFLVPFSSPTTNYSQQHHSQQYCLFFYVWCRAGSVRTQRANHAESLTRRAEAWQALASYLLQIRICGILDFMGSAYLRFLILRKNHTRPLCVVDVF